jgi:hypothetical protein
VADIIVDISPEGEVKIEGRGFKGAECHKATAALEAALGKIVSSRPTPEFYQAQAQKARTGRQ